MDLSIESNLLCPAFRPPEAHCQTRRALLRRIPMALHPDRLFPADPATRSLARAFYSEIKDLPIISPHGHTDPAWFSSDAPFENPSSLLITPDHYVFRMLYSQGIPLERLGLGAPGTPGREEDPREVWRVFARNFPLFR